MLQGGNTGWGCYTTTSTTGADYSCMCAVPTAPLEWRPSSACLQGVASATGGEWPPVCRHHKADDAGLPFRTGHVVPRRWDTANYACKSPDRADTQGYKDGIGMLPREFEVLCRGERGRAHGLACRAAAWWRGPAARAPLCSGVPRTCLCACACPHCAANPPAPPCGPANYCNYCGAAGRFSCLASGPPCTVKQQVPGGGGGWGGEDEGGGGGGGGGGGEDEGVDGWVGVRMRVGVGGWG